MKNVVLFTENYPYKCCTEKVFVEPELEALSHEFERVVIVPLIKSMPLGEVDIPNVEVDTTLAESLPLKNKALRLPYLLHPFALRNIPHLIKESPKSKIHTAAFYAMNSAIGYEKIKELLKRNNLRAEDTLLYCFWFNHIAVSCAMLHNRQGYEIVSRAHRYDVYEHLENYRPAYLRKMALKAMRGLYPVSQEAAEYLRTVYPEYKDKIQCRYIGSVKKGDFISAAHSKEEKVLTFFSCARAVPVKNLDINLKFIVEIGKRHPELRIKWIHVGDGPLLERLREEANQVMKEYGNVQIEFKGALPNDEVIDIYRKEKIDWTMLFSASEGLPITLLESLSYGVPALTSDVGGIPEAINKDNGIVFSRNVSVKDIAKAIEPYIKDYKEYLKLKERAYIDWSNNFDAKKLRIQFAKEIKKN